MLWFQEAWSEMPNPILSLHLLSGFLKPARPIHNGGFSFVRDSFFCGRYLVFGGLSR